MEQYSINDYFEAFRRRSMLFFGLLTIVFGAVLTYALVQPNEYSASAELRIELEGPNVNLLEPIMITTYADQYIKTLEQKVLTKENLGKWLEESDAYKYESEEISKNRMIGQMRDAIGVRMVFTTVVDERSGKDVNLITGFRTGFTARYPEAAESVANNVAAAFLAEDKATRIASATSASNFLSQQIEEKREEIAEIEAEIAVFKEQNAGMLPELMVLNMTALERTERELENIQRDIRNLQQDRFFREAQLEKIRQNVGTGGGLAKLEAEYLRAVSLYGPDHPDVLRIKRQVAAMTSAGSTQGATPAITQLKIDLAAAQQRYSEQHPDVIRMKRRLAELEAENPFGSGDSVDDPLYLQLRAQINATDVNLASLQRRAEELRSDQASYQDRIASTPQVERQYQVLQRELQTSKLAFDDLRKRLSQAQQTESYESGEQGARLQLVRSAQAPDWPTGPPRMAITIIGLFVAASLAGGAAIFAELTDNTVRGSRDIRMIMHTPAIASVPVVQNSLSRSHRRRQLLLISVSSVMLASIIAIVVAGSGG